MTQQSTPIVVPIVGFLVFFGTGLFLAFFPHAVRRYVTSDYHQRRNILARLRLFRWYVSTRWFIWEMRLWGVVCLLASGLLGWILFHWPPRS